MNSIGMSNPPVAAPADAAALDPRDPLAVLDESFHEAYAARREALLAAMGPLLAQIGDRLILRLRDQRLEGPARTRRYHELKAISHVPITVYLALSELRGPLDAAARTRISGLRQRVEAAASGLEQRCFTEEQLERQRRLLERTTAILDAALADGGPDPDALAAFVRAQTPDIVRNIGDGARDQLETMHATLDAWKRHMTAEERARLRAVVAVSHMSRPGNVGVQYLSVALGERWEGRFDQEDLEPGRRVIASEATTDEAAAFSLLATHALDARIAVRFFREESRMDRDLLADAAERVLADMFQKTPDSA